MISVVIPAYNAQETLGRCLAALRSQTKEADGYEVIVVDDGSTDATADVAAQDPAVRLIRQANRGPAAARNHGIRESRGEIVLFTDADCEPSPDWIERLAFPLLEDSTLAGTKGVYRTRQRGLVARFVQMEYESKYERMRKVRYIDFVDTYSAGFRKEVLLAHGGYDERFPTACAEDVELSYRLANAGCRMVFVPDAVVYHHHPDRLGEYLKKKLKFAQWRLLAVKKNPGKILKDSHTPQLMKLQALMIPLLVATAVVGLVYGRVLVPLAGLVVFFVSTLGFVAKTLRKDPKVALVAPGMLLGRSLAQCVGILLGLVVAYTHDTPPRGKPPGQDNPPS